MKTLTLLATLLFSLTSFASTPYIHCQSIALNKDYQPLELHLSGEGHLTLVSKLELNVLNKDSDSSIIKGLTAMPLKITEVDSFTKHRYGFGGATTSNVKVFAVNFRVSADESIGTEIQGCIPREINTLDAYTICHESVTMPRQ